jgi:hypothetical protein
MPTLPLQLPFEVHPYQWIGCLALIVLATWSYTRPGEHWLKRLVQATGESQAAGWRAIFRLPEPTAAQDARHAPRERWFWRIVYVCCVAALGAYGVLSILVLLGIAKNPPSRFERSGEVYAEDYEVVIDGHTISARKKSPAMTQATEDAQE